MIRFTSSLDQFSDVVADAHLGLPLVKNDTEEHPILSGAPVGGKNLMYSGFPGWHPTWQPGCDTPTLGFLPARTSQHPAVEVAEYCSVPCAPCLTVDPATGADFPHRVSKDRLTTANIGGKTRRPIRRSVKTGFNEGRRSGCGFCSRVCHYMGIVVMGFWSLHSNRRGRNLRQSGGWRKYGH